MTTISVRLGSRSYDVVVVDGALDDAGSRLAPWLGRRTIIVTDALVAKVQLPRLLAALDRPVDTIILPPGEITKSWAGLADLCDRLLTLGIERGDHLIAFGGGVIGDLVGFAAAIIKRGCGFVQIPTTLLAQVDSSVGGKTAINTAAGKNLVGAFHQPAHILIDPTVLDTLDPRQTRAGYAEVVKYGLIDDPVFFDWCEANAPALIAGDPAARRHAIAHSITAKARIVSDDERETTGVRALLNLGHTFGHALEADTGFSDRLLHGEAVAAGMVLAFRYSARAGLCSPAVATRVATHRHAIGLPTTIAATGATASGPELTSHMSHDKKMARGALPFLLARGIGETFVATGVDLADVAAFLDEERG